MLSKVCVTVGDLFSFDIGDDEGNASKESESMETASSPAGRKNKLQLFVGYCEFNSLLSPGANSICGRRLLKIRTAFADSSSVASSYYYVYVE